MSTVDHTNWSEDAVLTDALARFGARIDAGERELTLDLESIQRSIFDGDGPAYRVMFAMASVMRDEGMDGYRGAPRVAMAFLQLLSECREASPDKRQGS